MNFKKLIVVLLCMLSIWVLCSCKKDNVMADLNQETLEAEADMDNKMPDFSCETNKGTRFELYERKSGKPAFVNFWATWCGPCVNEMPELQEVYDRYKDKVDFVFINCGDSKEMIDTFLMEDEHDFSFPIGYDEADEIAMNFGITGIPTTIIVDKDNNVSDAVVGARSGKEYMDLIDKVLSK